MNGCSSLRSAASAETLLPGAFPRVGPLSSPTAASSFPSPGADGSSAGRSRHGWGVVRPAPSTSPPPQHHWRSQSGYLYTATAEQMSHQWDPFPAPMWLQTAN